MVLRWNRNSNRSIKIMGKIFLNHTGKLPFHNITTSEGTSRECYYAFYPQKFLHFDGLNNDIVNGNSLFYKAGCEKITGELPNLTIGSYMFYQAKKLNCVNLKTPNLTNGNYMFNYCAYRYQRRNAVTCSCRRCRRYRCGDPC